LWGGKLAQYTPETFLQTVWEHNPFFVGFKQHDAQEFAGFLLNRLGEEEGEEEGKKNFISNLFGGSYQSTITCKSCGYVSVSNTKFCGPVSVSIPPKKWMDENSAPSAEPKPKAKKGKGRRRNRRVSLEDCLRYTHQSSVLDGDNAYKCTGCGRLVDAVKEFKLSVLPSNYLIIQLVRTKFSNSRVSKDNTLIDCPLHNLDMKPFAKPGAAGSPYNLFAVVNHQGRSMNQGHFTCLGLRTKPLDLREASGSTWLEYNDKDVKSVKQDRISEVQSYMLFYERRELHVSPSFPARRYSL